jgi:hypothetical protein
MFQEALLVPKRKVLQAEGLVNAVNTAQPDEDVSE